MSKEITLRKTRIPWEKRKSYFFFFLLFGKNKHCHFQVQFRGVHGAIKNLRFLLEQRPLLMLLATK